MRRLPPTGESQVGSEPSDRQSARSLRSSFYPLSDTSRRLRLSSDRRQSRLLSLNLPRRRSGQLRHLPPAPKWRYVKPSGFESAGAEQMEISDVRNLGEVDTSLPFALSPDQRLFASFAPEGRERRRLEVRDLETLDLVTQTNLQQVPAALAWSPAGDRIDSCRPRESRDAMGVISVKTGNVVTFPQPVGSRRAARPACVVESRGGVSPRN